MSKRLKKYSKLAAIFVVLFAMMFSFLLGDMANVMAAEKLSDSDTSTKYTESLGDNASTEYAGRIWSDKSVYSDNAEFDLYGGGKTTVTNDSDFLIAYSALATSQEITGHTNSPLDVVFVIDLSGSMDDKMDNNKSRLYNTIEALNDSVEALMELNDYTRVAVVGFSSTATVVMPLNHYSKNSSNADYFSLSNNEGTLYTKTSSYNNELNISNKLGTGTNIQVGMYTGMSLLTASSTTTTATINGETVTRTPSVILLSDGAPTYSSSSSSWWAPGTDYNHGPGSNTDDRGNQHVVAGNGMKALMVSSYMKDRIDAKYGKDTTVYTIGMGIDDLTSDEQKLAQVTLNPGGFLNQNSTNTIIKNIESAWSTYSANGTPSLQVGSKTNGVRNFTSPSYTFNHPTTGYDIDTLNYVDHHYDANDASSVTNVFSDIVSSITIASAQVPTEIKSGQAIDETGHITYTDPIGEYMEVKDVKEIIYYGVEYTSKNITDSTDTLEGTTIPATTTYVFSAEVTSPIYGERNLNEIDIIVSRELVNGEVKETITISIPASVIPVRINSIELNEDGTVNTHTNNGALPIRVLYTVGMQDDILNSDGTVNTTAVSADYIEDHSDEDGTVHFYSNLYTGENKVNGNTAGNTTVEFEPSHTNSFYYMQEDIALYSDKDCTQKVSTTLEDDQYYYYTETYYHGTRIVTELVERTGAQLKKTDLIQIDGYWYREAGSPRLNRILEFEGTKSLNITDTAEDFYAPTFVYAEGNDDPFAGKYVIYLGNNGVLSAAATGTLEISKEVVIPDGLTGPSDKEFTFTIDFNGSETLSGTYKAEHYDADGILKHTSTITDGATITLKDGETVKVYNLPPQTTYTVTESSVSGFTTTVNNQTTNTASGTIEAGDISEVNFVNTYSVSSITYPANNGIQGTKVLEGRSWNNNDSFKFLLTPYNNAPMPLSYDASKGLVVTASLGENADGNDYATFDFGSITYTKPGVYRYTIVEAEPENDAYLPGMTYSRALYRVVVTVTDNGDGTLSAVSDIQKLYTDNAETLFHYNDNNEIVMNEGQEAQDDIVFTNTYSAKSVTRVPVATKTYTDYSGENPLVSGMFKFKLEAVGYMVDDSTTLEISTDIPMPADNDNNITNGVQTENEGTNVTFSSVEFTQDDLTIGNKEYDKVTYVYKMSEVIPEGANASNNYTLNGMTYDPTVYTIKVTISLNASLDTLDVEVYYSDNVRVAAFTNSYKPTSITLDDSTNTEIKGKKTLEGKTLNKDDYSFILEPTETTLEAITAGDVDMGTNDNQLTVNNEKDGTFFFEGITFNKAGVYTFTVKEVLNEANADNDYTVNGVTYDTKVVDVTVTVTDNNGQLKAVVSYGDKDAAEFTNTYNAVFDDSTKVSLDGTKTLNGQSLKNGQFYFEVISLNDDSKSVYKPNDENGNIELLKDVTYDKAGTYQYIIHEVIDENANADNKYTVNGMTYDTTRYMFTVEVVDDGNGRLYVHFTNLQIVDANNKVISDASAVEFTNDYAPASAKVELPAMYKAVSGKGNYVLDANQYEFTLTVKEASVEDGILLPQTITANDVNGKIRFSDITFTKAGTYTLEIKEVIPADEDKVDGIVYTDKVITLTYTVTDDQNGQLVAVLSNTLGGNTFTNEYQTTGTLEGKTNLVVNKVYEDKLGNDKDWEDEEFTFVLEGKDEATIQAISDGVVVLPGNETSASITINQNSTDKFFGDIQFNEEGTYVFRIREEVGNNASIDYDATFRTVTVKATDNGDGTLTVVVDNDNSDELTFTNVYNPDDAVLYGHGNLYVEKVFTGRENDQWLEDDTFDFVLTYGDDATRQAMEGSEPTVILSSGEMSETITITHDNKHVKHFGNIVFKTEGTYVFKVYEVIPEGTTNNTYEGITYDNTSKLIKVQVTNDNGVLKAVIDASSDVLKFTNTYETDEYELSGQTYLTIAKVLKGRDWLDNEEFKFVLSYADADTKEAIENKTVILENTEVTIKNNGTYKENEAYTTSFGNIIFKEAGTYQFVISEVDSGNKGIVYDAHDVYVTVTVVDNHEGKLVITDLTSGAPTISGSMTFTNTYTPDPIEVNITGTKELYGRTLSEKEFGFNIQALDSTDADGKVLSAKDVPLPASTSVLNGKDGQINFGAIKYIDEGTYKYVITETHGHLAGISYDEGKVYVTVKVVMVDGVLTSQVEYEKIGEGSGFVFKNVYSSVETDVVDIKMKKKVTPSLGNKYTMEGGEFTFELIPASTNSDSDPITTTMTGTNTYNGDISFDVLGNFEWKYSEAGEYFYTLHETTEAGHEKAGIIYDDTVYRIKVVVTDNTNTAKLTAKVYVNDVETNTIEFNNQYNPTKTSATIFGYKVLTGDHKELELNEFTFNIKAISENAPMPDTTTAQNTVAGIFQFDHIEYTQTGVYEYEITEVNAGEKGYTYDSKVYTAIVTVTDEDGALKATVAYQLDGKNVNEITFTNSYVPEKVTLEGKTAIGGTKKLIGRDGLAIQEGEFKFKLIDEDGNEMFADVLDNGTFTFDEITYTKAGTYSYTIVEEDTKSLGMTYDSTIYGVVVEVVDKGGYLEADVTYIKNDETVNNVEFVNSYEAVNSAYVQIGAAKVLDGRKLVEGEFRFVLEDQDTGDKLYATVDKDGKVQFEQIEYKEAGTYKYKLYEEAGSLDNVTYDEKVYDITVEVTDDYKGSLHAKTTFDDNGLVFVNTYTPDPVNIDLTITKILTGDDNDISLDQFAFEVTDSDGNVTELKADKDGKAIYTLTYDASDIGKTYRYNVKEIDTGVENVTYDTTVHYIIVEVLQDDNGEIYVETTVNRVSLDGLDIAFTNTYKAPTPIEDDNTDVLEDDVEDKVEDKVDTSDSTHVAMYTALALTSMLGLAIVLKKKEQL